MRSLTFRNLSYLAYALTGGALWGFVTFGQGVRRPDGSEDFGLLWIWVISGFIGSLLMVAKNQRLERHGLRMRIYLSDLAVIILALVLAAVLPSNIGLLKGFALLAVFATYYWWYQQRLAEQLSE